jgi:hypothetical protein
MAKKEKEKKDKKDKKAKGGSDSSSEWPVISVSAHPRASTSIRRSKAWAGLAGFALVGLLSWHTGVAPFEVGVRALVAGIVLYVLTWSVSVALWQRLVMQEAKDEGERRREELDERMRAMHARERGEDGDDTNGNQEAVA